MDTTLTPVGELQDVQLYENLIIVQPGQVSSEKHGIEIYGPGHEKAVAKKTVIRNCIIDFSNIAHDTQDEAIAGIYGANVTIEDSVIIGSIKAMLCGNGDYPAVDKKSGEWILNRVLFFGCGRRCPEAQDGVRVTMTNCLVENWGEAFDVRAFGSWAHSGASITAKDCIFAQHTPIFPSVKNFFLDLGNHIGEAWNDRPSPLIDYLLPGTMRGAVASANGTIQLESCYSTSSFTRLQNHRNPRTSKDEGKALLKTILDAYIRNPRFCAEVYMRAGDSILFKGL